MNSSSAKSTFAIIEMLALEMHTQMTFDGVPFSLTRFARQMADAHMILADADLPALHQPLTDALNAHPHRTITAMQIQQIYRHLIVMQDLIKMGGAK